MTKEEILAEIERLKKVVEEMDDEPKDNIYLLSIEEYEKYKDKIPHINTFWWLRSPGSSSIYAAAINCDGSVNVCGSYVNNVCEAVRPALKYSNLKSKISQSDIFYKRFIFRDFPFIVIDADKEIAIAEVPITFNLFDDESNDYENSYIRAWLLDWKKGKI